MRERQRTPAGRIFFPGSLSRSSPPQRGGRLRAAKAGRTPRGPSHLEVRHCSITPNFAGTPCLQSLRSTCRPWPTTHTSGSRPGFPPPKAGEWCFCLNLPAPPHPPLPPEGPRDRRCSPGCRSPPPPAATGASERCVATRYSSSRWEEEKSFRPSSLKNVVL